MAFKYVRRDPETIDRRAAQQGGDFKGFIKDEYRTYMVKKGDNAVRILPPTWNDPQHYGMDVWVHYGVGPERASVICPYKMLEKKCPVCEERARLERRGEKDEAKELKPAHRLVVWMLDRKDDKQGALVWGMPWTLDRDINKVSRDRETGKYYYIDDPNEGYDIYFDKEGEGVQVKYTGVQLARRSTLVDGKVIEYIAENPIPDTLKWRTYEEIKKLFEGAAADEPSNVTPLPTRESRPERDERREEERREPPRTTQSERELEGAEPDDRTPPWDGEREPERETTEAPREADRRPVEREDAPPPSSTASASVSGSTRAASLRERIARERQ